MAIGRKELHDLVEELPRSETSAAHRYLKYLRDNGEDLERARLLDAINEGLSDIEQGRFVEDADLDKEFGSVEGA